MCPQLSDNLWVISLAQTDHFIRIKLSTDVVLIILFTHQNEKEYKRYLDLKAIHFHIS
jgi:hypothetical protein